VAVVLVHQQPLVVVVVAVPVVTLLVGLLYQIQSPLELEQLATQRMLALIAVVPQFMGW
jgi:hypothetical protein